MVNFNVQSGRGKKGLLILISISSDAIEKMLESGMITIGKGIIENKPIEEADFRKVVYLALFGPGK